jgi:glucosamine-6-phosphate deaminase
VLLGIGPNGHIGMNEPGSPPDSPTRRVDLHDSTVQSAARYFTHQNVPRWGLTVGLKRLLDANEVWLLAKGSAKAKIVRDTLHANIALSNPASLLRRHPNASLFLDRAAGALLEE